MSSITINRNLGLDLVRFIAITLVLFAHSIGSDFYGIQVGGLGVEIFFVLSGFLIGQILVKIYMDPMSKEKLTNFWIRRWFRTIPIYYAVLLFKIFFIGNGMGLNVLAYFFFLQNNFVGIDFYPVTWSLVIEEWFYITVPILIFIFFRKGIKGKENNFISYLILLVIAEIGLKYIWVIYTNRPVGSIIGNFPFRLDSMLIGVIIAGFKVLKNEVYQKYFVSFGCFVSGFIGFSVILYLFGQAKIAGIQNELIWTRTIWFTGLSLFIGLQIPFIENRFQLNQKWMYPIKRLITWISLISYSVYLIHPLLFHITFVNDFIGNTIIKYIVTIVICSITYKVIELPAMRLRDKFKSDLNKNE